MAIQAQGSPSSSSVASSGMVRRQLTTWQPVEAQAVLSHKSALMGLPKELDPWAHLQCLNKQAHQALTRLFCLKYSSRRTTFTGVPHPPSKEAITTTPRSLRRTDQLRSKPKSMGSTQSNRFSNLSKPLAKEGTGHEVAPTSKSTTTYSLSTHPMSLQSTRQAHSSRLHRVGQGAFLVTIITTQRMEAQFQPQQLSRKVVNRVITSKSLPSQAHT